MWLQDVRTNSLFHHVRTRDTSSQSPTLICMNPSTGLYVAPTQTCACVREHRPTVTWFACCMQVMQVMFDIRVPLRFALWLPCQGWHPLIGVPFLCPLHQVAFSHPSISAAGMGMTLVFLQSSPASWALVNSPEHGVHSSGLGKHPSVLQMTVHCQSPSPLSGSCGPSSAVGFLPLP